MKAMSIGIANCGGTWFISSRYLCKIIARINANNPANTTSTNIIPSRIPCYPLSRHCRPKFEIGNNQKSHNTSDNPYMPRQKQKKGSVPFIIPVKKYASPVALAPRWRKYLSPFVVELYFIQPNLPRYACFFDLTLRTRYINIAVTNMEIPKITNPHSVPVLIYPITAITKKKI